MALRIVFNGQFSNIHSYYYHHTIVYMIER